MASAFGETEIVTILLSSGADINAKNNDGDTPLHKAILYPEINTVKILLNQEKLRINIENNEGLTARDIAFKKGWEKLVELLS